MPERSALCAFVAAALNEMMFCSVRNSECKPKTLAGLDAALEGVYIYDNHRAIQPIDAYEGARNSGEDGQRSERAGNVSDTQYTTH